MDNIKKFIDDGYSNSMPYLFDNSVDKLSRHKQSLKLIIFMYFRNNMEKFENKDNNDDRNINELKLFANEFFEQFESSLNDIKKEFLKQIENGQ